MTQITTEHLDAALKAVVQHADGKYSVVDVFNKAQELAEANAQQEQAIKQPEPTTGCACKFVGSLNTLRCELHEAWHVALHEWAERAKTAEAGLTQPEPVETVGVYCGNIKIFDMPVEPQTEWVKIDGVDHDPRYEPVQPHAELKAMYDQQVRNGTTEFYLWEFLYLKTNEWRVIPTEEPPQFMNPVQYRCTPKPTCQVRNLDTGELKTMTREAAKLLQAETKDTREWFFPNRTNANYWGSIDFNADGIYTYKLKANIVKKPVSWTDMPVGVMTNPKPTLIAEFAYTVLCLTRIFDSETGIDLAWTPELVSAAYRAADGAVKSIDSKYNVVTLGYEIDALIAKE